MKSEIRNKPVKNDTSSASSGCIGNSDGSCGATLFVGGLPFGVGEDEVRTFLQENIPNAQKIRVPMDRFENSIKGIAFVELSSDADVNDVVNQVSNLQMGGRPLKINESKPRISERPPRGSRGGYSRGNFGARLSGGIISTVFGVGQDYASRAQYYADAWR